MVAHRNTGRDHICPILSAIVISKVTVKTPLYGNNN